MDINEMMRRLDLNDPEQRAALDKLIDQAIANSEQ